MPDDALLDLIAVLERQEQTLVFESFTHDDAWALGGLLVRLGHERALPITIDIRRHGQQLFHAALTGTTPDNDAWIERKVRVVDRFHTSSFLVGRRLAAKGAELDHHLGVKPARYAAHGGSVPIRVRSAGVIGSVTVSGLAQADDHALVVSAIETFLAGPAE